MSIAAVDLFGVDTDDLAWQDRALCRKLDPEAFFPTRGTQPDDAKEACVFCPVRYDCLAYAVERGDRYGVWGGLTERERRPLVRAYRARFPRTTKRPRK